MKKKFVIAISALILCAILISCKGNNEYEIRQLKSPLPEQESILYDAFDDNGSFKFVRLYFTKFHVINDIGDSDIEIAIYNKENQILHVIKCNTKKTPPEHMKTPNNGKEYYYEFTSREYPNIAKAEITEVICNIRINK